MMNPFERTRTPEEIEAYRQIANEIENEVSAQLAAIDNQTTTYDKILSEGLPWQ